MGRLIVDRTGAARRPHGRAWALWVVLGCVLAWVVGYAIVKRFTGGQ